MSFYLLYKNTYFRTALKFEIWNLRFGIWNLKFHFGTVAEGLGRGLQNLLQQFESARYLKDSLVFEKTLKQFPAR